MSRGTEFEQGYGFEAVDAVLADPFPPGLDPATLRLPTIPKVRSAEDDEAHHREYWRAHVWAVLHRYRTAYEDPACPPTLRADHDRVAEEALRLVERATGAHPISPLDSVACHAALRDLAAGAGVLEQTVAALRGVPDVRAPEPAAGGRRTAAGADAPQPVEVPGVTGSTAPSGVHGHDFFASAAPSRGFEFRLSLRGSRGLKRSRQLAGDGPTEPPAAD